MKYSPEELKRMRIFEAVMQLRDLKAGDVVTQRQIDAMDTLIGPALQKARELQPTVATVNFTKDGTPYTKDGNPLGITIDGKRPLDLTEERSDGSSKET